MMSAYVTLATRPSVAIPALRPRPFPSGKQAGAPRFSIFPFGGGPRLCSARVRLMCAFLLAMIAQVYRVEVAPGHTVQHEIRVTLRPKQPMRMILLSASG